MDPDPNSEEYRAAMALRTEMCESLNPVAKELAMRASAVGEEGAQVGAVMVVDALITEMVRELEQRVSTVMFDRYQFCIDMKELFKNRIPPTVSKKPRKKGKRK